MKIILKRKSIRKKGYDYTQEGLYFITLCCENRECLFGEIIKGEMILNPLGKIAHDEWIKTPEIRNNIQLREFIVMPNHIHGIIEITCRGELHSPKSDDLNSKKGEYNSPLPRSPSQTIGAIVRGYKSSVTGKINKIRNSRELIWQRNYWEHIIRDDASLCRISEYIINNPLIWTEDQLNPVKKSIQHL